MEYIVKKTENMWIICELNKGEREPKVTLQRAEGNYQVKIWIRRIFLGGVLDHRVLFIYHL